MRATDTSICQTDRDRPYGPGVARTSNFSEQVAARLRAFREARGLSVRELARRSALAPELISRGERGVTDISLASLERVCAGLGTDLVTFFDFAKDLGGRERAAARRIATLLREMDAQQVDDVVRGIELLAAGFGAHKASRRAKPTSSEVGKTGSGRAASKTGL